MFREETTFRNGTIRGKFTYINFDQRYRLVHYTRLPYGPVRIDLVEELGRPDQNGRNNSEIGNRSSADVPNAVLQLRNILPNSLFGFPFLGPNSGQIKPMVDLKERGNTVGDDRSNMYFYSTDTIATPNLLTPSVPVSLLPGQRLKVSQSINNNAQVADIMGQNYFDQATISPPTAAPSSMPKHSQQSSDAPAQTTGERFKQPEVNLRAPSFEHSFAQHNYNQFHYASVHDKHRQDLLNTQTNNQQHQLVQSRPYVYSYVPQAQSHYSSPVQQPMFVPKYAYPLSGPAQEITARTSGDIANIDYGAPLQETQYSDQFGKSFNQLHQTHQPPSHEHYVAPFMFIQPNSNDQQPTEVTRVKLRVKTSKALNRDSSDTFGAKSAQLRASSNSHISPVNSPAFQAQRNQRRLGKQNQELNKNAVNTTPVVYHVLRSPVGRVYTSLPQYNAAVQSYTIDNK